MIDITKDEAQMLRAAGLWEDVHMSNRQHKSKNKTYFLTTSPKAMRILNEYRKLHTNEVYRGR